VANQGSPRADKRQLARLEIQEKLRPSNQDGHPLATNHSAYGKRLYLDNVKKGTVVPEMEHGTAPRNGWSGKMKNEE